MPALVESAGIFDVLFLFINKNDRSNLERSFSVWPNLNVEVKLKLIGMRAQTHRVHVAAFKTDIFHLKVPVPTSTALELAPSLCQRDAQCG